MGKKFGFSWSAKRALGVSGLRNRVARATGIPTTRYGLQRKIGRAVTKGVGCLVPVLACMAALLALIALAG